MVCAGGGGLINPWRKGRPSIMSIAYRDWAVVGHS